jgi:hypothetical protein
MDHNQKHEFKFEVPLSYHYVRNFWLSNRNRPDTAPLHEGNASSYTIKNFSSIQFMIKTGKN